MAAKSCCRRSTSCCRRSASFCRRSSNDELLPSLAYPPSPPPFNSSFRNPQPPLLCSLLTPNPRIIVLILRIIYMMWKDVFWNRTQTRKIISSFLWTMIVLILYLLLTCFSCKWDDWRNLWTIQKLQEQTNIKKKKKILELQGEGSEPY